MHTASVDLGVPLDEFSFYPEQERRQAVVFTLERVMVWKRNGAYDTAMKTLSGSSAGAASTETGELALERGAERRVARRTPPRAPEVHERTSTPHAAGSHVNQAGEAEGKARVSSRPRYALEVTPSEAHPGAPCAREARLGHHHAR